ncbi:MAG: hypothetical protein EZS28_009750 [Streblomastix strix]|uniref:Uncharacterized protein n=1 Tax=Streblomastix strix TaxID=222440 RepID=A0A5J4WK71_9EUKA|nr:MAG: hypothetical protein EZS28_009750 [Streblomastix strix]
MNVVIMYALTVQNNVQHARRKSAKNVYILESIVLRARNKHARVALVNATNATRTFAKIACLKEHKVQDVTINGFVLIVASFSAKHVIRNGALITRTLVKHAANAKTRLARAAIASVTSA